MRLLYYITDTMLADSGALRCRWRYAARAPRLLMPRADDKTRADAMFCLMLLPYCRRAG